MVRTVATAIRASGGKSSKAARASNVPNISYGASSGNDRHITGGNHVCPRETPTWQKPITNFFTKQNGIEITSEKKTKNNSIEQTENKSLGEGSSRMCNMVESEETPDKTLDEGNGKLKNVAQNQSNDNGTKNNIVKQSVSSEICDMKENNKPYNEEQVKEILKTWKDNFSIENKTEQLSQNKRNSIRNDDNDDIISAKRQKLDFYKHLEEIERNAS